MLMLAFFTTAASFAPLAVKFRVFVAILVAYFGQGKRKPAMKW